MITFRPLARASAGQYFRDDLSEGAKAAAAGNYYLSATSQRPRWMGSLVEHFKLDPAQPPTMKQLQNLLDGKDPHTGENILLSRKGNRRQGYDIVCTAPKSVSILGVLYDDRIPAMVREADRIALEMLEQYACARVRKATDVVDPMTGKTVRVKQNHDCQTGSMIMMTVEHTGSRELDPNLHAHHVTPNLTLTKEGELKALSPAEAFRRCRFFTEVFRNSLASQLKEAGYTLRQSRDSFEVEGVPTELIKNFSKSRQRIEKEEARLVAAGGAELTNNQRAEVAAKVKRAKNKKLTDEEVRAFQLSQIPEDVHRSLEQMVSRAKTASPVPPLKESEAAASAAEGAAFAMRHTFERKVVDKTWNLAEHALRHVQGNASWPEVRRAIRNLDMENDGTTCTTQAMQQLERDIIGFAEGGRGKYEQLSNRVDTSSLLTKGKEFLPQGDNEQWQLAMTVCGSKDRVTLVEAPPGAGKSFTLKVIYESVSSCVAVAPTASAVEVLVGDGIPARTLDSLLNDAKNHATTRVVICDEASLLSTEQARKLIDCSEKHGWRLVLQGDRRQNKSVQAGSPFALLLEYTKAGRGELKQIRRQKDPKYLAAVQAMSEGKMDLGLTKLERMGAVKEFVMADERREATGKIYADALEKGSVCCCAPTWHEIGESTDAIRRELRRRGKLAKEETEFSTLGNIDMTLAQRKHLRYWDEGRLFYVSRRIGKMPLGETGTFEGPIAEPGKYLVRDSKGCLHLVKESDLGAMQPVRATQTNVSVGDRILLQAKGTAENKRKLINGTTATVARVDRGQITLEDGRVLPRDYRRFTLGYVITAFSAQGVTSESAICIYPSGAGVTKKSLFVGLTRGKKEVALICDDLSLVRAQVVTAMTGEGVYEHAIEVPTKEQKRLRRVKSARELARRDNPARTHSPSSRPGGDPHGPDVQRAAARGLGGDRRQGGVPEGSSGTRPQAASLPARPVAIKSIRQEAGRGGR